MKTLSLAGNHTVGHTITNLPVKGSMLNEQLLAISGFDRHGKYTNNVYSFNHVLSMIQHTETKKGGIMIKFFACQIYCGS